MTAASAIQVVDDTLRRLADAGLDDVPMNPKPDVTVGPLDRQADGTRLNWFLYAIEPNPSFRNMEPPRTGSHTARGAPPLALVLRYLLTAYGETPTLTGDQDQISHVALAAAMRKLHEHSIIAAASPFLPGPAPLVEPIRIALETLDLDALSKLWTAASQPMRLSVGYVVSLTVIEQQQAFQPGPPVRERRVFVVPGAGPRWRSVEPARIGADLPTVAEVDGTTSGTVFRLPATDDDPAGAPADGWPMAVISRDAAGAVLRLPRHDLAPGIRRLDASTSVDGLGAGTDSIALTVVPTVLSTGSPVTAGAPLTLTTAHCAPDTEVFLDATRITPTAVTPTSVQFTMPATSSGPRLLSLRSHRVAGPTFPVTVTP
jgi:hypothetical protein